MHDLSFAQIRVHVRRRQTMTCIVGASPSHVGENLSCKTACTTTSLKSRMAQQRPHPVFGTGTSNRLRSIQHSPGQTTSPPGSEICLPNPLDPMRNPSTTVACISLLAQSTAGAAHRTRLGSPTWTTPHGTTTRNRHPLVGIESMQSYASPDKQARRLSRAVVQGPRVSNAKRGEKGNSWDTPSRNS